MATIPEDMKAYLKNDGQFNRDNQSEKAINRGLLEVAKRAVGNAIMDDKPYTIRINFQNGRIVGSEARPRLSVELLNGRSSTPTIGVLRETSEIFLELEYLVAEGYTSITNEGSWVARVKIDNDTVKSVFVNHDFSEEDRELIKAALFLGFLPQIQM